MEIKQHATKEYLGKGRNKKKEIKRYREMNDNDNTIYQNFWDMAKVITIGKFISLQVYLQN